MMLTRNRFDTEAGLAYYVAPSYFLSYTVQ